MFCNLLKFRFPSGQKKALQAHKAPKSEPEKPVLPKRPADARDAREVARKLIKSGAIQAIQRPITKQDQTSFKRPKGQERKRIYPDTAATPYQPFSSSHTDVPGDPAPEQEPSRVQNLYQQFASERDREERGIIVDKPKSVTDQPPKSVAPPIAAVKSEDLATIASPHPVQNSSGSTGSTTPSAAAAAGPKSDKPRSGNTIYVSGTRVTEEFLRKHFAAFGKIVNVSMEIEKGRGFITFGKSEHAEKAIAEMHGKASAGIQLQVQLARRQPQIEPINDASSSAVWSTLGE